MKKFFILLFFILISISQAYSLTLQAGVEYTVDSARIVAFQDTDIHVTSAEYSDNITNLYSLSDRQYIKNGILHVGIGSFTARRLVPFYVNGKLVSYGVQYDSNPNKKFYYSPNGKLLKFDICYNNGQYPYKALSYDNKGRLISVHLVISPTESYVFDSNKKLIGHWVNNEHYDDKGKKTISRHL